MEVFHLIATQFLQPMGTGRTHPVLLGAEDAVGKVFEVVVKLRGPEMSAKAQIAELVAAPLADLLGLDVPQAAAVNVPAGFDEIVPPLDAAAVRGSTGADFGSVHLGTSFTTWAVGRAPVGVQRDQAAAIFAFDLLVQNPDRRAVNPNLWTRSDRLGVYDHEQAFSFLHLLIIGGPPRPWVLADQTAGFRFMENHVFYSALRKVLRVGTPSLTRTNRSFHLMLRDGVPVEYRRQNGSIAGDHARLVDFADPRANDGLVVNQFTVIEGQHNRRPDIVVFVNGLPLGVIEELIKLAKRMSEATKRGEELGLNDDEIAFYDALAANESAVKAMGSAELRAIAAELVTQVRKSVTIDWTVRESARAKIKVMVKRILRKHGYPPDLQEEATQTVLAQAELLCADWVS